MKSFAKVQYRNCLNETFSRTDFAAMKEDLAFREDEIEKSKSTLEGLTVQHNQVDEHGAATFNPMTAARIHFKFTIKIVV